MKKYQLYIILIFAALIWSGCKKLVEVNPPKTQLVLESVFQSNETANSAMLTIYAAMFGSFNASPYHIPLYTGISGDELTNNNSTLNEIYINAINPVGNNSTNTFWNEAYRFIFLANSVYEGCTNSSTLDPDVKKQLIGEAMFIRAYWHLYLLNLYGDIPLITTTNYKVNATIPRISSTKVYDQIITDLLVAKNNLNDNYVGVNGITTSVERIRPNKTAASALLARTYLYAGKYNDAEVQATAVIDNTTLYALVSLDQVFLKNNKEAVWQIMANNNPSSNTQEGTGFIPTAAPPTQGKAILSPQLLSAFEVGDLRRSRWVGKYTDVAKTPNVDYYYPYKYKVQTGSVLTEYSMILRIAEQYLIRAEARNEQNNFSGAVADLNILRDRARAPVTIGTPNPLPALLSTLNKDQVTAAILQERRIELFTEQGHRWIDLKRTKKTDEVMSTVTPLKGGSVWNTNKQLWPIPSTEILNNPNMKQNIGYN